MPSSKSWFAPSRGKVLPHGVLPEPKGWQHVPHLPLSRAIFLSPHTPILGFQTAHCAACGSHARGNITTLRQWILTPCSGMMHADLLQEYVFRPARVPHFYTVRVAGKLLHATHQLKVFKHLYFCVACGKIAGHRVQQLGEPCVPLPVGSDSGRQVPTGVRNIRRLKQGLLPQGTPWWPSDIPLALRGHTITL